MEEIWKKIKEIDSVNWDEKHVVIINDIIVTRNEAAAYRSALKWVLRQFWSWKW